MAQVNAYLHFDGTCRQAMTFYKECPGGELTLMTVGESPAAAQMPHQAKDSIMHSVLRDGTSVIMASDNLGTGSITRGNQFSMTIECGSNKEAIDLSINNGMIRAKKKVGWIAGCNRATLAVILPSA